MTQPSDVAPLITEAREFALHRIGDRCIEEVRVHPPRHAHIRVPQQLLNDLGIRARIQQQRAIFQYFRR